MGECALRQTAAASRQGPLPATACAYLRGAASGRDLPTGIT